MTKEETIKRLKELHCQPLAIKLRKNNFRALEQDLNYLETSTYKKDVDVREVILLLKNRLRIEKIKQYV